MFSYADDDRIAKVTEYAGHCNFWWLRTRGCDNDDEPDYRWDIYDEGIYDEELREEISEMKCACKAGYVDGKGRVCVEGERVDNFMYSVRPAIRIAL
ncbi:hypothetical protein IJT93_12085 [bacterium]|nr:hypothetical protein [bacterium]